MIFILVSLLLIVLLVAIFVSGKRKLSFTIKLGVVAGSVCLLLAGMALFQVLTVSNRAEIGEGVDSVAWLDSRASDISFFRQKGFGGVFVYEFSIKEDNFVALANERDWKISRLASSHYPTRYMRFSDNPVELNSAESLISVRRGLFYEDRQKNGGGITVTYDSDASRAYVFHSSR